MRRSEREITDPDFMQEVLQKAPCMYLSLNTGRAPYVFAITPFLYNGEVYFHCAREGRKIDLIKENPLVGFSAAVDIFQEKTTMRYKSVSGSGILEFIEDPDLKQAVLKALAEKFNAPCALPASEKRLSATQILHLKIDKITGKYSREGEPPRAV